MRKANKAADAKAAKDAAGVELSEAALKKLRVRALRALLKKKGVECSGCTEKHEFVKRVLETRDLPEKVSQEEGGEGAGPSQGGKKTKKKRRTVMQERRHKQAKAAADAGLEEERT